MILSISSISQLRFYFLKSNRFELWNCSISNGDDSFLDGSNKAWYHFLRTKSPTLNFLGWTLLNALLIFLWYNYPWTSVFIRFLYVWVAHLNERFCSNLLVLLWDLITGDVDWVHFHWYERRMKLNERGLFLSNL